MNTSRRSVVGFVFPLFFLYLVFSSMVASAQVDSVIVEKYYVSDANDATDTTAADTAGIGVLSAGSVTYRVYVDLCDSCRLKKIYGDANHGLKFLSDSIFFNHKAEGKTFGNDLNKNRLKDNPTVALDTWLTLDHATKNHSGVLKTEDTNVVSILGGTASGGQYHPGGFLNNNDPQAGIPLTSQDGLVAGSTIGLTAGDELNFLFSPDSTIFGSLMADSQFVSYNAFVQHNGSGVQGPTPANRILVAQLTTRGQLRFELNIEVLQPDSINGGTKIVKYVANNNVADEVLSPYLTYPPVCGCTDKNYVEYNPLAPCLDMSFCQTLKRFGCTDTMACNYDPAANVLLTGFCCYPGYCQDRDLSTACSNLSERYSVFPNPADDMVAIQLYSAGGYQTRYEVYDLFGRVVLKKDMGVISGTATDHADVSRLQAGLYLVRMFVGETYFSRTLIKN